MISEQVNIIRIVQIVGILAGILSSESRESINPAQLLFQHPFEPSSQYPSSWSYERIFGLCRSAIEASKEVGILRFVDPN